MKTAQSEPLFALKHIDAWLVKARKRRCTSASMRRRSSSENGIRVCGSEKSPVARMYCTSESTLYSTTDPFVRSNSNYGGETSIQAHRSNQHSRNVRAGSKPK